MRLTPKPHSSDGKEQLGGISKWATRRSARCSFVARRRRNRARQQDGEDHLGAAHQGRDISKYWYGERRSTRLSRTTTRTDLPARRRTEARCKIRR
ncbi:hypothetical protein RFM98_31050 [Mesorhizobium sp. VK9D]|nr:hypothetical protein [Mesorhizobium sp. VK9D]MDX8457162.1 hypothetical protein [Mesorhizobium sp. VK9D]